MKTDRMMPTLGFAYLRLSNEETQDKESGSITNQRMIIQKYCQENGINLVKEFVDDGWSGGNFDRPAFQQMMRCLENGLANLVITKDLSRLGRDMRESSYYAEQFFPEHGIRYIAIGDNFDTEHDNILAPFQFAMNEVYLRDGSKKIREVLKNKRADGQYCTCPPYGYKKDPAKKNHLVPDENTAPIVQKIFNMAAQGYSSRAIAMDLTEHGIIPPLKYRVIYRDNFGSEGASHATDVWNYTTVKRILKNQVYLGHTLLGKSKKISVKSKKKIPIPQDEWAVTHNTHCPIVSNTVFDLAQANLGRGNKNYTQYDHVRKSIFSGIAYCAKCGHAMCSCGTVYNGEREKYWYLSCTRQRKDIPNQCSGVRIRYADLVEIVRLELNALLKLSDKDIDALVQNAINRSNQVDVEASNRLRREKATSRIHTIDKMITKLYTDNAEGKLDDNRLQRMVSELEKESAALHRLLQEIEMSETSDDTREKYKRFFSLAQNYSHIDTLDRDTLVTFVEEIEIGPKELPDGVEKATHRNQEYRQKIRIFYRFIGEISQTPNYTLPLGK